MGKFSRFESRDFMLKGAAIHYGGGEEHDGKEHGGRVLICMLRCGMVFVEFECGGDCRL